MYFRTNWQREQQREYELLTSACAVADLSSFGKFELTGSEARQGCSISFSRTSLIHLAETSYNWLKLSETG